MSLVGTRPPTVDEWEKYDLHHRARLATKPGITGIIRFKRKVKKMKTTLLIMAAGIGSRFGTGIKQLEPVDDANHIIMDYSIHDAIETGFNHVVFIIRKDIEKEFKEVIGDRIAKICEKHNVTVDYAFQDINDIPGTLPGGRTKPWGTGQAVLAAKSMIDTPFIVINADDYYGKEGFKAVHDYLVNGGKSCMAGFVLKNTLSDNGGVTRGICKMDENGNLTEVVETKNIVKTAAGAEADGVVINTDSLVSMNMWGLNNYKRKEVITMPRTKGSKNRPKTNTTKDYASQIAEKQESIVSLTAEIASITANIDTLKADLKEKKTVLKKVEKEVATLEAKKAKADAKAAEEAKKTEAEAVLKKLLASGMSAEEILEKLK